MTQFTLSSEPLANNQHPQHRLFQQYSKSSIEVQNVYRMLVANPYRRFSIEDVSRLEGCSYLSAYRACRRLTKLGVAAWVDVSWTVANQRGQEKIIRRVAVEFRNWHESRGLKSQECEEVLSLA